MPNSDAYAFSLNDFCGSVRLFPLPNLVLFPHVMQPLHIFEPRYRQLLSDAMKGDRLIAMAVLQPGWEGDYEGTPEIGPIACLGRIIASQKLDDGTHNALLVGLRRVRLLEELDRDTLYRQAKAAVCEETCSTNGTTPCCDLTARLHDSVARVLPVLPNADEQLESFLSADLPLGILCDVVAFSLGLDTARKEALLAEMNIFRRAESLLTYLDEVANVASSAMTSVTVYPPQFSPN
ncbi:MAG: LON peptidase substrate-binding domain-containing protein [Pirellulales bacterium]|nr:LON peptidase substrate-binding domain-containing protein [Pirellulales bacterium]